MAKYSITFFLFFNSCQMIMQCYLVEFFSYWYQVDPHNEAAAFFFFFFLTPHDENVNSAPEKNGLGFFSQIVLFVGYLEPERKSV